MGSMRLFVMALAMVFCAGAVTAADKAIPLDAKPKGKDKLYHIVAIKFKDGTSVEAQKEVADAFRALEKKISQVKDFEGGESVSVEKLNKDFHYCAILEFKDIKELRVYMDHPDHKAFVELLKKHLADVFVFDFWE
jgi:multidrug efflux pump subunit AcrB